MQRMLAKHDLNWSKWAELAQLGAPTTLSRAVGEDYKSVTSIPTLHALATSIGEPSVLDFLAGETTEPAVKPAVVTPNADTLVGILAAILPLLPPGRQTERSLRVVAAALAHGLELLGDQTAKPTNQDVLGVAARGALSRFREMIEQ